MNEALASLLSAAALVGAPAVPPVPAPRAAAAPAPGGETTVAATTFAAIAAAQSRGFVARPLGADALEVSEAFDADAAPWITVRSGAFSAVYSEAALKAGATADLPGGRAALTLDKSGTLTVAAASGAAARVSEQELLDALYSAGVRVRLGVVDYAALYQDGRTSPASLCLLRRDAQGNYFVAYYAPSDARKGTIWILAVDGVLYGMRARGPELVFVSKPLSSAARRP